MPANVQGVASGTGVPPVENGTGVPPVPQAKESAQPPGGAPAKLRPARPGSPGTPDDPNDPDDGPQNWRKVRMKLIEDIRPLRSPDYWRRIRGR